MAQIKIYCRAYNVEPYLEQCISSVLGQTYGDFEFHLIDNGCTDGSGEIMDAFAAKDSRIHLIRFEKNTNAYDSLFRFIEKEEEGYIAIIDSDDWWEPEYLERLLAFLEQNDLDIACAGVNGYRMDDKRSGTLRGRTTPLVVDHSQMAAFFPMYHAFFRTYWGKLFRARIMPREPVKGYQYGGDTLYCFQALRRSRRIGICSGVLYNYRIHGGSVSGGYHFTRFLSDVQLYEDALEYLVRFGPVSQGNRQFLRAVFSNAVLDTVKALDNSGLSPVEKARDFCKIAEHPFTVDAYRNENEIACSHDEVTLMALILCQQLKKDEFGEIQGAIRALLPHCGGCVTFETLPLFFSQESLLNGLIHDDADTLASLVLSLIQTGRFSKRYDLGRMMQNLAKRNPLLSGISNAAFMCKYSDIYKLLWQKRIHEALEQMTSLLLEGHVRGTEETFLNLYIAAAAQLEEVSAFIFGNIRLAEFQLRQGCRDECRRILADLKEMNVEENEEIKELWQKSGS